MLSIIIPIYNTERYLRVCLNSLVNHIMCNYEIILVDDGSIDNSSQICDEYAGRYDNIRVIHQDNRGVSAARNIGIEEAKGEWLWFVDGDDYIENDVRISNDDKHMITMGCLWEENNSVTPMVASSADVPYNTWRCLFRRDMVMAHNIRFTEGRRYAEDQEFILKYMLATGCYGNIGVIDDIVYHYTVRPGSAVSNRGRKMKMGWDVFAVWCKSFVGAIHHGVIFKMWMLRELKRLAKTLYVTMVR